MRGVAITGDEWFRSDETKTREPRSSRNQTYGREGHPGLQAETPSCIWAILTARPGPSANV